MENGKMKIECVIHKKTIKSLPPKLTIAKNFTQAIVKHLIDRGRNVVVEDFIIRLNICNGCDQRIDKRCAQCGCFIDKKAWWASEDCPLKKWPQLKGEESQENVKVDEACSSVVILPDDNEPAT